MKKIENVLWRIVDILLFVFMIAMVLLVFANVVLRYGFNHSLAIADELSRIFFVWIVYIGSIVAMKEKSHIRVDIVLTFLPALPRKIVEAISNVLMDAIMILTIRVTMNLVMENLTYPMPLTKIPYGVIEGIIPLSMLLMLIINVIHLIQMFIPAKEETAA